MSTGGSSAKPRNQSGTTAKKSRKKSAVSADASKEDVAPQAPVDAAIVKAYDTDGVSSVFNL